MDAVSIFTALDMTYGILTSMTVQGAHNVKALANALTNIEEIMKAVNEFYVKSKEVILNDSDNGSRKDLQG